MTAAWWVAHVLAFHLSVPEPVRIVEFESLWPSENHAQMMRVREGWEIQIDRNWWRHQNPRKQAWILAHELCHGAYNDVGWSRLTKKEKRNQHKRVNACASKIIRDHRDETNRR